jgi:hypothetical protein
MNHASRISPPQSLISKIMNKNFLHSFGLILLVLFISVIFGSRSLFAQKKVKYKFCQSLNPKTGEKSDDGEFERVSYDPEGRILHEEIMPYYIYGSYFYDDKGRLIASEGTGGESAFWDTLAYHSKGYEHRFYNSGKAEEGSILFLTNENGKPVSSSGKICSFIEENDCYERREEWKYDEADSLTYYAKIETKMQGLVSETIKNEYFLAYDKNCRTVNSETYLLDNQIVREKKVYFTADCKLSKKTDFAYSVLNTSAETEFFYNEDGKLIKKVEKLTFSDEKSIETSEFLYDNQKRLVSETVNLTVNEQAKPTKKISYDYEKNAHFTKTLFGEENKILEKEYFDAQGLLLKKEIRDESGKVSFLYVCQYEFFD